MLKLPEYVHKNIFTTQVTLNKHGDGNGVVQACMTQTKTYSHQLLTFSNTILRNHLPAEFGPCKVLV